MLAQFGLVVDECYSILWRESKYTLIHLSKENRVRRTSIIKVMQRMKDAHGIVRTEIFGFDSVSCNSVQKDESLESHPGFMQMVEKLNSQPEHLKWWMSEGTIESNRKGLLWKFIECTNPNEMTRAQLIQRVSEWGPVVKDCKETNERCSFLSERLQETERVLQETTVAYEKERGLNDNLMQQLAQKIEECGDLHRELLRLRSDTGVAFL